MVQYVMSFLVPFCFLSSICVKLLPAGLCIILCCDLKGGKQLVSTSNYTRFHVTGYLHMYTGVCSFFCHMLLLIIVLIVVIVR